MGIVNNIISKLKHKKERLEEVQQEGRIQEKVAERKLSANEREYNGYMEERRQDAIKRALQKIRHQKRDEFWHKDIISQKNLFTNQKNIFKNQKKLFS